MQLWEEFVMPRGPRQGNVNFIVFYTQPKDGDLMNYELLLKISIDQLCFFKKKLYYQARSSDSCL